MISRDTVALVPASRVRDVARDAAEAPYVRLRIAKQAPATRMKAPMMTFCQVLGTPARISTLLISVTSTTLSSVPPTVSLPPEMRAPPRITAGITSSLLPAVEVLRIPDGGYHALAAIGPMPGTWASLVLRSLHNGEAQREYPHCLPAAKVVFDMWHFAT